VEKNTNLSRFYNSLTARYNIYFNGYESHRAGVDKVNNSHIDDFGEILPVFEYSNPASATVSAADMEAAIQKVSKLITLKSITAKPEKGGGPTPGEQDFQNLKEYNKWVDDSYLLMAKARFYKREYDQARATIAFNNDISTDEAVKIEGSIWLARIQIESGNLTEALRILTESGNPEKFSASLRAMYYSTLADIYIRQGNFAEAIAPLTNAVEFAKSRRQKHRLTFLLAQIYGATGQSEKAITTYNRVIKMRPPYEIEFNARINSATAFDATSGNSTSIRNQLLSMIKDDKNKDFLDQIYYALGRLSEKEGKMEEAISYYRMASGTRGVSGNGRGRAYLALATYFFDIPDYLNAKTYYDSAAYFLDEQYPGYDQISAKASGLGELVTHLETVHREDSLRRVASMSEPERAVLIAGIIEKVRQDELAQSSTGSSDMYNLGQFYENERRFRDNIDQEGQWYFYNQAALTFGRTEFSRRWGDRRLEDNWRRQNKRIAQPTQGQPGEEGGEQSEAAVPATDPKSPEYYLRDLPMTDSLIKRSIEKSANALFMAGRVYSDRFDDTPRAAETWLELVTRFPEREIVPQTFYQLYMLFRQNDPAKAEIYRQSLLTKYPGSDYSKILTNPDYFRIQQEAQERTGNLYEEAYAHYRDGNYEASATICGEIINSAAGHKLMPKVRLLYSLSLAGMQDERGYRDNLASLIKEFPGSEEATRASELMLALNKEMPELKIEEDRQIAAEIFYFEPDAQHLFVLLIENPAFNINQASFDVINYNIDNYTNRNFRAEGQLVDNRFIIITVGRFNSAADAREYYNNFKPLTIVRNSTANSTKTFIITPRNLDTFLADKDPERYMLFFREKYNIQK
jgi:tetratricopeptide (TPR) repeat protein